MIHSAGTNGIMSSYQQRSIKLPSVMGSSFSKGMKQFKKDIIIEGSSDRVSICLNAMSATAIAYSAGSNCNEMNSAGSTCNEVNCLSITHIHAYTQTRRRIIYRYTKAYMHMHRYVILSIVTTLWCNNTPNMFTFGFLWFQIFWFDFFRFNIILRERSIYGWGRTLYLGTYLKSIQ